MYTQNSTIVRFLGGKKEHIENALVAAAMLAVTALYVLLSKLVFQDFVFNIYEFIGTWSALTTVWLCRTQNILCWPWGIVSAVMFGFFFGSIELPGQQWLNWGYFLAIQLWAWPYWVFGGKEKTELPVTALDLKGRALTLLTLIFGIVTVYTAIEYLVPESAYPLLDSTVVSSSVVAQYLLGRKNIESWYLWLGPVNTLSIGLFYLSGAYTVMALYIAFFVHAVFAIKSWSKSMKVISK